MSIKKKLGMGVASAALGIALVGGGTFAYFSDTENVNNTFAAGTLDLEVNPSIAFKISNLKPGDHMTRSFDMTNGGSLDIGKVLMNTSLDGNTELADHLQVDFLTSDGKVISELSGKKLSELVNIKNTDITPAFSSWWGYIKERGGIPKDDRDTISIKITFVDNNDDQNFLQGKGVSAKFELKAEQTKGQNRTSNDK